MCRADELLARNKVERWNFFGKRGIGNRRPPDKDILNKFREAVKLMGAHNDIHMRHAFDKISSFLLSHASCYRNDQRWLSSLVRPQPSEIAQHLLVGLLSDDVCLFQRLGFPPAVLSEQGVHLEAVQVVHLAAVGEDLHVSLHGAYAYILRMFQVNTMYRWRIDLQIRKIMVAIFKNLPILYP